MGRKKPNSSGDLAAIFEKALRRGKKLERSLTKIVAHGEPGSSLEDLLKNIQNGLEVLKKEAKANLKAASRASAKARPARVRRPKKDIAVVRPTEESAAGNQA